MSQLLKHIEKQLAAKTFVSKVNMFAQVAKCNPARKAAQLATLRTERANRKDTTKRLEGSYSGKYNHYQLNIDGTLRFI